jgi:hypothetical protein
MIEDLFQIPVFLFALMYIIIPTAFALTIILFVVRRIIKSVKKTIKSITH